MKTPISDEAYQLSTYDLPYDTSYGDFNRKAWEAVKTMKLHMEKMEKELQEKNPALSRLLEWIEKEQEKAFSKWLKEPLHRSEPIAQQLITRSETLRGVARKIKRLY